MFLFSSKKSIKKITRWLFFPSTQRSLVNVEEKWTYFGKLAGDLKTNYKFFCLFSPLCLSYSLEKDGPAY